MLFRWIPALFILLLSGNFISTAQAQYGGTDSKQENGPKSFFKVSQINIAGKFSGFFWQDLDGDDLADLVVKKNKEWLIYFQGPSGFPELPTQRLRFDESMLVYDFGEIDAEPGRELVYHTKQGIKYYKIRGKQIEETPVSFLEHPSIFGIFAEHEDKKVFQWDFVRDFNQDGLNDVIIPMIDRYALYSRNPSGSFELMSELEGETYSRLYEMKYGRNTLYGTFSTREILVFDYNGDGRQDIVSVGKKALKVFFQDENRAFAGKPGKVVALPFKTKEGMRGYMEKSGKGKEQIRLNSAADLNNDGLLDLIAHKISLKQSLLNPKSQIRIYLGKEDKENPGTGAQYDKRPDQIIISEGTQISAFTADLDGDQKLELIIPTLKLGLLRIVKMLITSSATLDISFYKMGDDQKFGTTPIVNKDVSIKYSFSGGLTSLFIPSIDHDFNGDGLRDLLTSEGRDEIVIFYGNKENLFSDDPDIIFEVPLPKNGTKVKAGDINSDGKADILMYYDVDDDEGRSTKIIRVLMAEG